MENKLGRKSLAQWQEVQEALTTKVYKDAFKAGYDAKAIETPDVDEMAELLIERYTDVELDQILALLDDVISHKVVKSANEQRAELIQQAREFVEEQFYCTGLLSKRKGYSSPTNFMPLCDADFIVNQEKRTVACLLREQMRGSIQDKGIAKCHPDEVFNADIGKAIALARALEIEIPKEFMRAVQPDKKVIGMDVFVKNSIRGRYTLQGNDEYAEGGFADLGSGYGSDGIIIDDTNAQY